MTSTRVTFCLTHPVQYFSPWFRYMAEKRPELDVTVLYMTRPDAVEQGTGFGSAFTWDVPLTDGYRHTFLRNKGEGSVSSDAFFGVDVPDIRDAIARTRPDVVVVPGWHSVGLLRALRACRELRVPAVYRGDSNLLTAPHGWRHHPWELRTRVLLRYGYAAWLAVGRRSREYLDHFGAPDPLVFHSPHAVDNDYFACGADRWRSGPDRANARAALGVRHDDFALLFAGKLVDRKRPLDVIRAAQALGPDTPVVVVGDGPLRSDCELEAARLGVRLIWRGFANQSEMPGLYAAADCLVLPSDSGETWGLVINEALASGTPCVVSDHVGAGPDLIRPGTNAGETYPAGNTAALADAVRAVRARSAGVDIVLACRAAVARHTFAQATDGLAEAANRLAAMTRVSIVANPGAPRVLALCTGMVMVSGIERMSFEVLKVLREQGAAVHCIVNRWGSRAIVDRVDGLGASWSTGYSWYQLTKKLDVGALARSGWDVLMTSGGLVRDAWRFRPTHVFLPEFLTGLRNLPALFILRACGIPVIMRLGNAPEPGTLNRIIWRWLLDRVVTRFVSNSDFIQRELLAHGINPHKAATVRNTVPLRTVRIASVHPRIPGRIIYVGQIIPPKGLDLLLEAVASLRARGRNVTLDVIGNIEEWEPPAYEGYRAAVRERAARPDLAGYVRFLGVREDVPALLSAASLHCCPSRPEQKEGCAVVNLEAKRAGIPSVVFPTGSLPEIISHGQDGFVCEDVSVESLVEGLDYFLSDPERLRRAGEQARISDRSYSRERFVSAWLREFGVTAAEPRAERAAS